MPIFKNRNDNDDLLASDLAAVYRAPRMSATSEAAQRQRIVAFATTLDRVAASDGGTSTGLVAANTETEKRSLGRLRAWISAVAMIITITVGVLTVAHNLWGDRVPIYLQVSLPSLQHHAPSAVQAGTRAVVKRPPLAAKHVTLASFFNYDTAHVTSIDGQGATPPKVASVEFSSGVKMDVTVDQYFFNPSLEMSLNTQTLPHRYKALTFYLGLADDSKTSGQVIFEIDRDGVVFRRMTVQAGTIAQQVTVPFEGHALLRFFTRSVDGECCGDLNVIVGNLQAVP